CNEAREARCETPPQRSLRGLKETRTMIEQKQHRVLQVRQSLGRTVVSSSLHLHEPLHRHHVVVEREQCEHGSAAESDGGRRSTLERGARSRCFAREGLELTSHLAALPTTKV